MSPYFTTDKDGTIRPQGVAWDIGPYEFSVTGTPTNNVNPTNQNFGAASVGSFLDRNFTVQNSGGGLLSGNISATSPFSIVSGGSYNLIGGQSQQVTIRYSPTTPGTNSQTITFSGGGGATASLIGIAYSPTGLVINPQNQDFGGVAVGSSVDQVFALRNFGPGAVSGSASVAAPFNVVSGGNYSLSVGQTQAVTIRYTPTSAGTNNSIVNFSGGAGTSAAVTGVGLQLPIAGVDTIPAGSGSIASPFVLSAGNISQSVQTMDPAIGGRATYDFVVTNAGSYVIQAIVNAPSDAANSFYINIDAEPQDPTMIWDLLITSGFQPQFVSWRGNGTDGNDQFSPKAFDLGVGQHTLVLTGREANTQLQSISFVRRPAPPQGLRFVGGP